MTDMTKRRDFAALKPKLETVKAHQIKRGYQASDGSFSMLASYHSEGYADGFYDGQAEMQEQLDAWKQNCLEQVEKVNELAVELSEAKTQLQAKDAVIDIAVKALERVVNHLKDEAEPEQVVICKEALEQIQKMRGVPQSLKD